MKKSTWFVFLVAAATGLTGGCGSTNSNDNPPAKPNPAQASATVDQAAKPSDKPKPSSPVPSNAASAAPATSSNSDPKSGAKSVPSAAPDAPTAPAIDAAKSASDTSAQQPESSNQVAPPSAPAATAKEAVGVLNAAKLPRLNEAMVLQSGPTNLSYNGQGSVPNADTHVQATLKAAGWKEIPGLSPATEQFVDRIFEKDGYYVRANIGQSGSPDEFSLTISNLGNIDVRNLPRLADADTTDIPSTPINFTYRTNESLADAQAAIHQQMLAAGWQVWNEYNESPIDVPHFRNSHYRKEACRLNVGLFKNPENPNDKTSVFYHAESVIPFDIPTLDATQPIKLDLVANRASFATSPSRAELVELLQKNSERYGWSLKQTDKFVAGEIHLLAIDVDADTYLVARLSESGGKYSASLESYAVNKPSETTKSEEPTESTEPSAEQPSKRSEIAEQIDASIQDELSKALAGIESQTPMNLDDVKAKVESLQNEKDENSDDESSDEDGSSSKENPFDVAEDATAPPAEIQAMEQSIGSLKFGDKTYELKHVAGYVIKNFGFPTKCLIFSTSPIDIEKLQSELLKDGRPVHGLHVSEEAEVLLDLRVSPNDVQVSAQIDGNSLTFNTEEINAKLFYFAGKLAGTVKTDKPIELVSEPFEFSVQLNQPIVPIDWAQRD